MSTTIGIAEFFCLGFPRFGDNGELHNTLLQSDHALGGAADHPQGNVFVGFEPDFLETHFECEFSSGSGYVSAANFSL